MKMDKKLLQFLNDPASYAHVPDSIEHVQTHISHVFIAGVFVYKIKKPVNFEFLDFSTLEKRKYYCEREVELNRRLCEDIYLNVVSIRSNDDTFKLEDTTGENAVEYAVKMKRLSEEHFLHSFIERGELGRQQLDRIAAKLAEFYKSQKPGEEISQWGEIDKIRYNTDENFRQTKDFVGDMIDGNSYNAIKQYTNQYYGRFDYIFDRRIEDRRIVDGHGDLHLEHIHITPEKVRIYDCIEFNDRFRYGDTAEDLAFLAMDLDFNECRQEERYFVEKMADLLGDKDLPLHIDFYKCYRAYVKGKVKGLQAGEEEVGEKAREKARNKAREYFKLSLRYSALGSRPAVLVLMGRIGTGKSTIAETLSEKLNIDCFSSDRIRKRLMGVPLNERPDVSKREQMYSRHMSIKTYTKLRKKVEAFAKEQKSVILDATYSRKEEREKLVELLHTLGVSYYFIETQATDEVITERLKLRKSKEQVISDARLEDFEELIQYYQPPKELNSRHLIGIDTEQNLDESLSEIFEKLITENLNRAEVALDER